MTAQVEYDTRPPYDTKVSKTLRVISILLMVTGAVVLAFCFGVLLLNWVAPAEAQLVLATVFLSNGALIVGVGLRKIAVQWNWASYRRLTNRGSQ